MARIEVKFYDKDYIIEFDRESVKDFFKLKGALNKKEKDPMEQTKLLIALIKCGLIKHHADDIPSDDVVFGWVMAMGKDAPKFMEALRDMVNDVITTVETDRKNFQWGKVD